METKQIIDGLLDRADRVADQSAGRIMKRAAERLQEMECPWVSVKDRLPEKNGPVLVCTRNSLYKTRNIAKANFRKHSGGFYGQGGHWANVTHWMPLPPVPPMEVE